MTLVAARIETSLPICHDLIDAASNDSVVLLLVESHFASLFVISPMVSVA